MFSGEGGRYRRGWGPARRGRDRRGRDEALAWDMIDVDVSIPGLLTVIFRALPRGQDLQLRGYSDRTVEAYVRAVAQLATFYHTSPDRLCDEQIRRYLLHLSTVQKVARGTHTIALCGITFFSQQTLGHAWTVLDIARPKRTKKLPVVLSRDEVWRILDAVRIDAYRVCLTTIYAGGLRLMEGLGLPVPDSDSDRALFHIHGKGGKDRYVPLPDATHLTRSSTHSNRGRRRLAA